MTTAEGVSLLFNKHDSIKTTIERDEEMEYLKIIHVLYIKARENRLNTTDKTKASVVDSTYDLSDSTPTDSDNYQTVFTESEIETIRETHNLDNFIVEAEYRF